MKKREGGILKNHGVLLSNDFIMPVCINSKKTANKIEVDTLQGEEIERIIFACNELILEKYND